VACSLSEKIRFIERVFGPGKLAHNEKNLDVRCPICAPRDNTKRKLSIHVDDDRSHCWTCGWKSHTLAPLIKKYGTREQLAEYCEKYMPLTSSGVKKQILDAPVVEKLALPSDFKLLALMPSHDPDARAVKNYVRSRGITDRDIWYFKLGCSDELRWRRRVIIPSFDSNGELNYYVGRAIDRFRWPKYDNPNTEKLPIIFNELNVDWKKELVLCEGVFDLMKCPDNAVPLLGSDLHEESALFNMIVANNTPVALALDADMRVKKTPKIARKLAAYDVSVRVVHMDSDPGDMSRAAFREALNAAKEFDWFGAFIDKLDVASRMSLKVH